MKWIKNNINSIIYFIYLATFLICSISVAFSQPMALDHYLLANPPDEISRFLIPWYVYRHGALPTGLEPDTRIPGYGFSYAIYPMLPYIIQGFAMRLVGIFTTSLSVLVKTARFVNIIFGFITAIFTEKLARRLFKDRRFAWMFAFLVTMLPEHIFMHTYINTDSMCMLSTALIMYGLVCIYQDDISWKNTLILSLGIICCIQSYYNAYGYVLISVILFFGYFVKVANKKITINFKPLIKWGLIISAIVILGCAWHFIRNAINLKGDFLGMYTRKQLEFQYSDPSVNPSLNVSFKMRGYSILQMIKEMDFFGGAFLSMVAVYGSLNIFANVWTYRFYKLIFCGALLWPIMRLIGLRNGEKINGRKLFFDANMILACVLPTGLLLYYAYTIDGQNQGRYLLPILIPFMWCIVRGFERFLSLVLSLKIFSNITLKNKSITFENIIKTVFTAIIIICSIALLFMFIFGVAMPIYRQTGFLVIEPYK